MLLIAFAGPAGAGKTTAATILGTELGIPLLGFADPIREAVLHQHPGWDSWHLGEGKDIVCPIHRITPRRAMRDLGDDTRSLQHDIYIQHLNRRLGYALAKGASGAVIHDLRTDDEARWMREAGGWLIYLRRSGVTYREDHLTECEPAPVTGDLVLDNPGTISGLRGSLVGLLVDLRRRAAA